MDSKSQLYYGLALQLDVLLIQISFPNYSVPQHTMYLNLGLSWYFFYSNSLDPTCNKWALNHRFEVFLYWIDWIVSPTHQSSLLSLSETIMFRGNTWLYEWSCIQKELESVPNIEAEELAVGVEFYFHKIGTSPKAFVLLCPEAIHDRGLK